MISSLPLTKKNLDEVVEFSHSNTSSTNMVVVVSVFAICCYANVTVVAVAVVNAKLNYFQTMNLLLVPFAFRNMFGQLFAQCALCSKPKKDSIHN